MTGIIFAETGLLVGFFLAGDSLLVAAWLLTIPASALISSLCYGLGALW